MSTSTRFTLAILSPLCKAFEAGEDPAVAVRKALKDWESPKAPEPVVEPEPDYPFQITIPEGEVRHIRAIHGCIEATARQTSWLQKLLAQQQLIMLGLIDELKGYHNVPQEVPYHLNLANVEGEVTCFIRGDLAKKLAELQE